MALMKFSSAAISLLPSYSLSCSASSNWDAARKSHLPPPEGSTRSAAPSVILLRFMKKRLLVAEVIRSASLAALLSTNVRSMAPRFEQPKILL